MSLDVYLEAAIPSSEPCTGSGIFVRRNGQTVEITREEWDRAFPGQEPIVVAAEAEVDTQVYSANITHNLGKMAAEAGIYEPLWRPDEIGVAKAHELIEPLTDGLAKLKAAPDHYRQFNSPNGWGLYEHFVPFVEDYLNACKRYPTANVRVWR